MSGKKLLIADSETLAYQGLRAILGKGGGIDAIKWCEDESEMLTMLPSFEPDIITIDYTQHPFFSIDSVRKIRVFAPKVKIMIISTDSQLTTISEALRLGVEGYLTRQCDEDEIIHSVFSVLKNEKFYCNKIVNILLEESFQGAREEDCAPTNLTARETEVVTMVATGMTTQNIADHLTLSYHTIHTHRKNVMRKLNCHSASDLTLYAVRMGLVNSSEA
jgi:two-component system invasion response regulator UvrY